MSVCTKPELQNGARTYGYIAGDSEQYAQHAQTAARNMTIKNDRHMQLFCSCDVVLTLELVCELAKKKNHVSCRSTSSYIET
jgi:hypothetical protein